MSATPEQIRKWDFFCREIAKANDTLDAIELTFSHINMNGDAYNAFFALVIDALTTKVFLNLGHIFDSQDDSLRLANIATDKHDLVKIEQLKKEAQPFLEARHRQHAHLSKIPSQINYNSNFRLMDRRNATKIRETLDAVGEILRKWGVNNNNGAVVADHWGNIKTSTEILFENLEEHEYMRSKMSTYDHVGLREEMRNETS